MATEVDEAAIADSVRSGDRRALARAITLVESSRREDRRVARGLLARLLPQTGGALRLGLSGAPGSGKSSLIEALGLHAVREGRRVAVLAVDPSSSSTGGSILGDKTRMTDLARHPHAFIRPSPSSGSLGGVAGRTREAMLLCEASGFDVVVVETVGVGQSEVAVADMVDLFVLVASPAGGDELQGMKRGITELADLIVVNKADGQLAPMAEQARSELRRALSLLRPKRDGWTVEVHTCSALTGEGIAELWQATCAAHERLCAEGLDGLRAHQDIAWMWSEVTGAILSHLHTDEAVRVLVSDLEARVGAGTLSPTAAARELLSRVLPLEVVDAVT